MEARQQPTQALAAAMRRSGHVVTEDEAITLLTAAMGPASVDELIRAADLAVRVGVPPDSGLVRIGADGAPYIPLDGWMDIINRNPSLDGIEFDYSDSRIMVGSRQAHEWISCTIWRKDRTRPTVIREYIEDCYEAGGAGWAMPNRMLRHRALVQCARVALGLPCGVEEVARSAAESDAQNGRPAAQPMPTRVSDREEQSVLQTAPGVAPAEAAPAEQRPRRRRTAASVPAGEDQATSAAATAPVAPHEPLTIVRTDDGPVASDRAVQMLQAKLDAMVEDEAEREALLVRCGVQVVSIGMSAAAVDRINDALMSC